MTPEPSAADWLRYIMQGQLSTGGRFTTLCLRDAKMRAEILRLMKVKTALELIDKLTEDAA